VASELKSVVRGALARRSDDHRRVLELVSLQGLTFEQAGARMDRSGDAVRKMYGRALASLTERLSVGGDSHVRG
jgi:DNA-directed RNA polymerase specialized sigma24 family protein